MHVRTIALCLALAVTAHASPRARVVPDPSGSTAAVCSTGPIRCFAHVQITPAGEIQPFVGASGLFPADLWAAYQLDPNITTTPTIATVDAYGYTNLEADLATYRAQFGLPACTQASGCLTILNQRGAKSPLPAEAPPGEDWTVETALDVDMASAMCPKCKLVVVQADDPNGLFAAEDAAVAANPTVISNSWGAAQTAGEDVSVYEPHFDHPGIGFFASSGDHGYDEGGKGPTYPSTSAHVIAVGGTSLVQDASARGWNETAWSLGGSSCSLSIAKPSYQPSSPCAYRVAADISAVADPATGVAVYNTANGGWMVVGGTSAASPIVAALFASIGHGNATPADIAQSASALFDVTSGSNGSCGSVVCNAGVGWDGPTGYGTPNAALLTGMTPPNGSLDVTITSPGDGATVKVGFMVDVKGSAAAVELGLGIDGVLLEKVAGSTATFATPTSLPLGPHVIEVGALDAEGHEVDTQIQVMVVADSGNGETGTMPGCSAGGGGRGGLVLLVLVAGTLRRRKRRA